MKTSITRYPFLWHCGQVTFCQQSLVLRTPARSPRGIIGTVGKNNQCYHVDIICVPYRYRWILSLFLYTPCSDHSSPRYARSSHRLKVGYHTAEIEENPSSFPLESTKRVISRRILIRSFKKNMELVKVVVESAQDEWSSPIFDIFRFGHRGSTVL